MTSYSFWNYIKKSPWFHRGASREILCPRSLFVKRHSVRCVLEDKLEGSQRILCYARWQSMEFYVIDQNQRTILSEEVRICLFPSSSLPLNSSHLAFWTPNFILTVLLLDVHQYLLAPRGIPLPMASMFEAVLVYWDAKSMSISISISSLCLHPFSNTKVCYINHRHRSLLHLVFSGQTQFGTMEVLLVESKNMMRTGSYFHGFWH